MNTGRKIKNIYNKCHYGKTTHFYRIHKLECGKHIYLHGSTFFCETCNRSHVKKLPLKWKISPNFNHNMIYKWKVICEMGEDKIYSKPSIGYTSFIYGQKNIIDATSFGEKMQINCYS